ncbi:conserved hypothetical protein [Ricinus communis]|uniref:Uncharacterized protein n=1 Tax=Ricinus communis TaxID=3988 RepID=B9T138_RICCO|nr:conserved hypothetical protein [Ricinus communis]
MVGYLQGFSATHLSSNKQRAIRLKNGFCTAHVLARVKPSFNAKASPARRDSIYVCLICQQSHCHDFLFASEKDASTLNLIDVPSGGDREEGDSCTLLESFLFLVQ